jgi:pilus assembly protein CpaD
MSLRSPILFLALPALALSACASDNRGMESVHQPIVNRTDYVLDLNTAGYGLAAGEQQRLAGWMNSLRLGYGDRVYLDEGEGYGSGARDAVAAETARYGMLLGDVPPVTPGAITPGTVRVVVTRMTASVPECPDFRGYDQPNFNARTSSNFGCATNANLAAMIANPADLVRGQPGAEPTDSAVAVKAIDTYRRATPTGASGLKSESPTGGGSQ